MELREFEAFVAVAATENFTRAATKLHCSQSAVSQQIRSLEEQLGEELFIRSNRRVRLSKIGKDLLPTAQEILRLRSVLLERTKPMSVDTAGRLTVGTSAAATAYLWAKLYKAFAEQYPRVEMDIRTMQRTQDTIDHVMAGDLDVGFAPLPLGSPGLDSRALGFQEALLAVPPGHRLADKRRVAPKALADEEFILYEPQISIRWLTDDLFRRTGISPRVILESNDTHFIKAMVTVGFGIAFLPNWSVERELREGHLRVVEVLGPRLVQEMGLIFRRRGLSSPGRLFVEFCIANRNLLPKVAQTIESGLEFHTGSRAAAE